MRKIAVKMRKYINRISVLVTVFAVLVTASFYNPASLAADASGLFDYTKYQLYFYGLSMPDCRIASDGNGYFYSSTGTNQAVRTFPIVNSDRQAGEGGMTIDTFDMVTLYIPVTFMLPQFDDSFFNDEGKALINGMLFFTFNYSPYLSGNPTWSMSITGVSAYYPDGSSVPLRVYKDTYNGGTYSLGVGIPFIDYQISKSLYNQISFDFALNLGVDNSDSSYKFLFSGMAFSWDDASTLVPGYSSNSIDSVINGYDASSGNTAQSTLDNSLSQSEAKQDSLFTSASDTLSDFTLSDISTMPKVVNALSFVSSTMTSIYTALGGINGVGIVLSVGCSILFVSLAVGAYKFYSSHRD